MSNGEQDTRASGSVPHAYGNALAWRWVPEMPSALKRAGLHTLLYALRSMANANGELRFHGDRKPIRIQDIAKAAGADEKDIRDRLEAARLAGVVVVKGERRRGRPALYAVTLEPRPDWSAAVAYLDGVKQLREEAKQERAARKGTSRKAAPWAEGFGGRAPELPGSEFGGPTPELTAGTETEVRGTAPRMSSGDRPPNGSGDRPPNNPGSTHVSTHERAEVFSQPQVVGPPDPQDHESHEAAQDAEPPPGWIRCARCEQPLIPRYGRTTHPGCQPIPAPERTAS